MMVQDQAESTMEPIDYARFINQFQPDIIKSTRQIERSIQKYVDKKFYIV